MTDYKKFSRYALFSSLYFSQGAIMSYFTALNALYLQSFGLDLSKIGVIGTIAMVPFVLKIFLGLISDKINFAGLGYRKPYIVIGILIQAGCLFFVPMIDPGKNFWQYAFLAFLMMSGMALYDTCTDGLALDTTPKNEEGLIQSFMVGGRAAGMVIVSAILGIIAQKMSWRASFYLLAVITLSPLFFISQVKEIYKSASQKFNWNAFGKFRELPVIMLALLGALYSLIINGANQLVNPYLVQRFSINLSSAGFVATAIGFGIIAGSSVGGTISDKIGQRRTVVLAMVISLIATVMLAGVNQAWMIWVFVAIFGFSFGFYETVYFAIAMNLADRRIAATMFSIMMAVANIGTGIGLGLTGVMADRLGFGLSFVIIASLNVLAIPLIGMIFPKNNSINSNR